MICLCPNLLPNDVNDDHLVILRKSSVGLIKVNQKLTILSETQLPSNPTMGKRRNNTLCIADTNNTYNLIDLTHSRMFPLLSFAGNPSISVLEDVDEFLITTNNDSGTLGFFINSQTGEPKHGTLQWPSSVLSIQIQHPHIFTLLSNNSIQIHSSITFSLIYTFNLGNSSNINLVSSLTKLPIPNIKPDELNLVNYTIVDGTYTTENFIKNDEIKTEQCNIFLIDVDNNRLSGFLPPSIFNQACYLLDLINESSINQAVSLAKTLDVESNESQYIYLMSALKLFSFTHFSESSSLFTKSDVDIRFLLKFFPSLIQNLFDPNEQLKMFKGVAEYMSKIKLGLTIDEVVTNNLNKNYYPHLNTETDEVLIDLKKTLMSNAKSMLVEVLSREHRKRRNRRRRSRIDTDVYTDMILDTTLAIIFAEKSSSDRNALNLFISQPNTIMLPIVESTLIQYGRYCSLAKLYEYHGDFEKSLEILKNIIDHHFNDIDSVDPLNDIVKLLKKSTDSKFLLNNCLWLLKQNRSTGLNLLCYHPHIQIPKKDLLNSLKEVDEVAEQEYLETIVLSNFNKEDQETNEFKEILIKKLINNIIILLNNSSVINNIQNLQNYYLETNDHQSFLTFLSTTVNNDEINDETKQLIISRIKLIIILQIFNDLNWNYIIEELNNNNERYLESKLWLERSLILCKFESHKEVLDILGRKLKDNYSSQHYCTYPGYILSVASIKKSVMILNFGNYWLIPINDLVLSPTGPGIRNYLLKILLDVYMLDGHYFNNEIGNLLNSQSLHLNLLDVSGLFLKIKTNLINKITSDYTKNTL